MSYEKRKVIDLADPAVPAEPEDYVPLLQQARITKGSERGTAKNTASRSSTPCAG